MALFVIERNFAEALSADAGEETPELKAVNAELGLEWVTTFLTADRTRTYCLYEASSADSLREQAQRLGIPADSIVEVTKIH